MLNIRDLQSCYSIKIKWIYCTGNYTLAVIIGLSFLISTLLNPLLIAYTWKQKGK